MTAAYTVGALFSKQCKDIFRNVEVLILFFVYPLVAFVMTNAIPEEMGQADFFISIFGTMHIVFTPMVAMASMISEEKEKNTLRVLVMSNVKPAVYLLSIGGFVFICTMITAIPFVFFGGFTGMDAVRFMVYMAMGCICSLFLGGLIGTAAKNMMGANAVAVPLGLVISFMPMLSFFQKSIKEFSRFVYGQQISDLLANPGEGVATAESFIVVAINMVIFRGVFLFMYRRNKLEV